MKRQKMLTVEILKKLPPLYSQEKVADPVAQVKFFNPCGAATWWATEFDGEDRFFGWADLGFGSGELGYFSLSELQAVKLRLGLYIERDTSFTPAPLSIATNGAFTPTKETV